MTTTTSTPRAADHAATGPSQSWVMASLALCVLLPALGTSIANVALPTLAQAFGAPFRQVQWVVLAYLVALTALTVVAGRLGDLTGRRRLLGAGIALFTVASALCAVAPGLGWLFAARALQGLGAAAMMALTLAFVGDALPRDRAGRAMGLLGTLSAVGTALGPTLGGALIAAFGWQAIFLMQVPLGLLAWMLVRRCLPADRAAASRAGRIDLWGSLWLTLALAAYALAMTAGRAAWLVAAALALVLFLRSQAQSPAPLIPPAAVRDAALRGRLAANALVSTVVMATLVVGPFHLAQALGLGTAWVGVAMSVGPVVSALTGVPAGRLADRFGTWRVSLGGLVAMALGCLALCLAPLALGTAGYLLPLGLLTAGYALFQAANNTAVMADVAADQRGVRSGLLNLSRNLGLVTGASAMGTVFAFASEGAAVAVGTRATFAVAAGLVLAALWITTRRRPLIGG